MKRVAIIGAGITGLAAAWHLQQSKEAAVEIFESSAAAGGVLRTKIDDGYLIETSADNFATLIPDAKELAEATGYEEHLITPNEHGRRAFVLSRGQVEPIPLGFSLMQPTRLWSVITTPVLSWSGKIRVLFEWYVTRRSEESDESLESFVTRRLGKEAFEALVEPIVSGIFTADPSKLSMQATMPQFVQMEQRDGGLIRGYLAARKKDPAQVARKASGARYDQFLAPRQGMSHFIDHLVSQLDHCKFHLSSPVDSLLYQGDSENASTRHSGWTVRCAGTEHHFDAVILAVPTVAASKLLQSVNPEASELVGRIQYASSAVLALVVKREEISDPLDGFGLVCPTREGRRALAISYTSNKYPDRVPDDEVLLRVFLGGARDHSIMNLDDCEIEKIAFQEVREILGWSGEGIRSSEVIRWNNAMPQYHVGHKLLLQNLDESLADYPTLQLCGAGYRGVGIPQCVRDGRGAASRILDHWSAGSKPDRPVAEQAED